MEIDKRKVDEITVALLYLTTFKDKHGWRAWKSHDWDVLNRLHESGFIDDPVSKVIPEFAKLQVLEGYDKATGKPILRPVRRR